MVAGHSGGSSLPQTVLVDRSQCKDNASTDATTLASSQCSDRSSTRALAQEVGLNAHEYLEECFYTEVGVLDRAKFDAIPQVSKDELTTMGHLGKGSFSDVYKISCRSGRLGAGNQFAMKILMPQLRSDADQFTIGSEDLVHETAILANINHKHIIELHGRSPGQLTEVFLKNDGYFILLDLLDETLHDRIESWKVAEHTLQGPTVEQLRVSHDVADAILYLHSRGIIFRDLKPANVGFDSRGVLKLFDLGFAIGLPEKEDDNPEGLLYDRCGTPRYMAPEVGLSLGYGKESDVYSFGVLLWEICSFAKPFAHITSATMFERAVFKGGERPPVELHWPKAVRDLMAGCWHARQNSRPAITEVRSSLETLSVSTAPKKKKSAIKSLRSRMSRKKSTSRE